MFRSREFRAGLRDVGPILVPMLPFGTIYGALAIDAGLTPAQALGMSVFVYAGASQMAALQLIVLAAPMWAVLLSMLIINFRHVLYSASVGRSLNRFSPMAKAAAFFVLVDPSFAAAEARAARGTLTKTYYFTYSLTLYIVWFAATLAGIVFGGLIENSRAFALDFVLPVYFLAQAMAFQKRPGFFPVAGASVLASSTAYFALGSPWHIMLGGLAGLIAAALMPLPVKEGQQ
ncbi:AzlC family ABC transporter permease [Aureimonas fodinaquatilis]|uniref:AzlC family ABC transporter permease n=1 Tax=Aureimonas fodinaquatilis TaxID=2565783 RepID=A0A5B0E2P0_9HYPH|nr:AzlC family ABC transporter permease [Aureimonas fodinaquatilis]KAA0972592.1 AzlC family ABC transporter permease [Aureimonas fodinaquatilis]